MRENSKNKPVLKTGHAYLLLLFYFFLSIHYSYERILSVDNSNFFFQIVNAKSFWFPENRFGIVLSQIPLILCAKLGLSLSSLVYIYSCTFILEYIGIAWLCAKILKVKEAVLIIALSLIVGVSYSFFHPVTETYHALIITTLLYALIVSPVTPKIPSLVYYLILILVSSWGLISHPISVFSISFVVGLTLLNKKIKIPTALFLIALPAIASILRIVFVDTHSYDTQQYSTLFAHVKDIPNFYQLYPFQFIIHGWDSTYLSAFILLTIFVAYAINIRQYKLLLFCMASISCYTIIAVLTFANGDADIMMEKTFLLAIYMLIISFCHILTYGPDPSKRLLTLILFCIFLISAFSFFTINTIGRQYNRRLNLLTSILASQQKPKVIANYSDFQKEILMLNHWNTGIDALIIAKCKLKDSKTIFFTEDKNSFSYDTSDVNLFLGPLWWTMWNNKTMDSAYFYLPPSTYVLYPDLESK